jgi:biotin carboxylase
MPGVFVSALVSAVAPALVSGTFVAEVSSWYYTVSQACKKSDRMNGATRIMMKSQKKLMVLGASYSQIPLMKAARRLGLHVTAVSIKGPYQGFDYADDIVYADITNPKEVLRAAEEKRVDGVTTCCMDLGVEAMGVVNEHLHLSGPGIFAARAARNKAVEKQAYREHGVPTALFCFVHSREELKKALSGMQYPVILKASDQMGSRGIRRADSEAEAILAYEYAMAATKENFCILEEFLEGTMFGVEAMMSNGKLAYVLPLGNDLLDGNPPFPIGHYVPWAQGEAIRGKIEDLVRAVAEALHFDNCAMDLDCMYKDGKVYVIEATARAGATCITDTVGIYYGIDYYEAIVKAAMGIDVSEMFQTPAKQRTPNVSRLLFADMEGIVSRIDAPAPGQLPDGVVDLSFNISEGSHVQKVTNGRDRIGQLIVRGESIEACRKLEGEVLSQIHLEYRE